MLVIQNLVVYPPFILNLSSWMYNAESILFVLQVHGYLRCHMLFLLQLQIKILFLITCYKKVSYNYVSCLVVGARLTLMLQIICFREFVGPIDKLAHISFSIWLLLQNILMDVSIQSS